MGNEIISSRSPTELQQAVNSIGVIMEHGEHIATDPISESERSTTWSVVPAKGTCYLKAEGDELAELCHKLDLDWRMMTEDEEKALLREAIPCIEAATITATITGNIPTMPQR